MRFDLFTRRTLSFLKLAKDKMTELESVFYEDEHPLVPEDDFSTDEDDNVEANVEDDLTEIQHVSDSEEDLFEYEPVPENIEIEEPYSYSDEQTQGIRTTNVGHFNILEIHGRPTVNKIIEALGRDPVTDVDVVHHLERNVANFVFPRPHSTKVAHPYVLKTLKKWKCTARFVGDNSKNNQIF